MIRCNQGKFPMVKSRIQPWYAESTGVVINDN